MKSMSSISLEDVLNTSISFRERVYYRLKSFFEDLPWLFKWRFQRKHQYNILRTGLRPGYYDPDIRILYAVMEQVSEFVARETGPRRITNWSADPETRKAFAAYLAAANWWYENKNTLFDYAEWSVEERKRAEAIQHLGNVVNHLWFMWY